MKPIKLKKHYPVEHMKHHSVEHMKHYPVEHENLKKWSENASKEVDFSEISLLGKGHIPTQTIMLKVYFRILCMSLFTNAIHYNEKI